ncbi:MAG: glycosyltransferase family 2 protein [Rhodoferax sp.]|uniref:glycosyltransferase family 2 protein n=1 Tax=Rhodoferax sp. TaxID=50421 RepID=UPI00271A66FE|nr:glycosyltransferase family 2 protein [Rhodoferax sp.]MDO8449169.1 glycosyltransferase family 2 protein [Rhodoferax sp.]
MKVSVIVPTMATQQRAPLLKRAIESIRHSSKFPIRIIVVVNGKRYDSETCEWLKAQPDIHFEYLETASAPKSVLRGRELVTSEFFSTLDDDDEYLEGATDKRIQLMELDPAFDLVVSNGYRNVGGIDRLLYTNLAEVTANSLRSLMDFNWLSSCNALYRTASVELAYFTDSHAYAEWTWLAYRLAKDRKNVGTLNRPTFRINDTADSLSKSESYDNSYLPLFERMLDGGPPANIARLIRRKMAAQWHAESNAALTKGNRMRALKCHWQSLLEVGGLQYLSYSRKFFLPNR